MNETMLCLIWGRAGSGFDRWEFVMNHFQGALWLGHCTAAEEEVLEDLIELASIRWDMDIDDA